MTPCPRPQTTLVQGIQAFRRPLAACFGFTLLLLPPTSSAQSQVPAPCEAVSEQLSLTETLPLPLLDHLEKISSSPFVHAFLLAHVAERGTPEHDLTGCVVQFLQARPDEVAKLRATRVNAGTLIRALRIAERDRIKNEEFLARHRVSLDTVVTSLLRSPQDAFLGIYTSLLASADSACTGRVCEPLGRVRKAIKRLKAEQDTLETITRERDDLNQQLTAARRELEITRGRVDADSTALVTVRAAFADASDSARQRLVSDSTDASKRLRTSVLGRDSVDTLITRLTTNAGGVEGQLPHRTRAVADAVSQVSKDLHVLHGELRKPSESTRDKPLDPPERQEVRARTTVTPAATVPTNLVQRAPSASVLMELTDFVIDRAKQEVVLSYLATLYRAMRGDAVLQSALPGTHQLMRGLTVGDKSRLSVVAAGRIPLTVWRATLKDDFHTLPINLLQAPDSLLCRGIPACRARVVQLRPVAGIVARLIQGEPVFEVIRDAPRIAIESGTPPPDDRDIFIQTLRLLSAIAETYQVQGLGLSADPVRHPFILSVSALRVGDQKQLAAFARLLVLRIIPETETDFAVSASRLTDASRRATAAIEGVATAAHSTEPAVEQARQILGSAVAALRAADGIVPLFRGDATAGRTPGIREFFLDVAEPLVVRDYALAMSRTAVLLHELTGGPISGNLLTLASLASSLAEAQSGAEVRAALETASSPVGGWQAKRYREGRRTSITAFPGFAYGAEWMVDGPYSRTAGAALPIGADVQVLPRARSGVTPACFLRLVCSAGVFVPVIDLGALLSYRLDGSDAVKSEPNTGFRQVFAPGAYLSLGLAHSAFALLLGGQFMPNIREVAEGSGISGHAWRVGTALTVDVMLFAF